MIDRHLPTPRLAARAHALANEDRVAPGWAERGDAVLADLVAADPRRHVRRRALGLLARAGKWPPLAYLIRLTGDPDPAPARSAATLLGNWIVHFNRSPARPTTAEVAASTAALDASGLPPETERTLRFLLRGW